MKVYGEIGQIKKSIVERLKAIYEMESTDFIPLEISQTIAEITKQINKEVSIYLNRRGRVVCVSVGDDRSAPLPMLSERRNELDNPFGRLSGLRCIHTHPNGSSMPSQVDISALKSMKFDAMIVLAVDVNRDEPLKGASATLLVRNEENGLLNQTVTYGGLFAGSSKSNALWDDIKALDKGAKQQVFDFDDELEAAFLIAIDIGDNSFGSPQALIDELEELALAAGVMVVDKFIQKRDRVQAATFVGTGFLNDISLSAQAKKVKTLIFDDELSAAQIRNIELITGCKVIDRTTLILDIFAKRASTHSGKLQVELAQLKYRLPRLAGLGKVLSRLGGGIGTRGPGEKKIETDRRHIYKRIDTLEAQLKQIEKQNQVTRKLREKNMLPSVSIVGYTNAGKSSLLNELCDSEVLAKDQLFATLDPSTRGLELPNGQEIVLTDTVGFIRKLPHDLINAFKSTLEEAVISDLILLVADISSDECDAHIKVCFKLLDELKALNKPVILVLNKCDLVSTEHRENYSYINPYGPVVFISVKEKTGLDDLLTAISQRLPEQYRVFDLLIPFADGKALSNAHELGEVLQEDYLETGYKLKVRLPLNKAKEFEKYEI